MLLTAHDIAKMLDLSCVRTYSSKMDIEELVENALKYNFGQVSVMQCFIPYTRQLLGDSSAVRVVGNVSFPSGSDTTTVKVFQAREMLAAGSDEIDMVINVGRLRSGELAEVEADLRAVVETVRPLPVKVIIEIMYPTSTKSSKPAQFACAPGPPLSKQAAAGLTAEQPSKMCAWCVRWSASASKSKPRAAFATWPCCWRCTRQARAALA